MIKRVERLKTNPALPVPRRRAVITGAVNAPRASLLTRQASIAAEEAETNRLMTNWVRWKSGAPIGVALSAAYALEAQGRREGTSIPLLNGEASDVDDAVSSLPRELYVAILIHWLRARQEPGGKLVPVKAATVEQRARACGCSERTYFRRLEHAHERVRALMRAKRREGERRRAEYRRGAA